MQRLIALAIYALLITLAAYALAGFAAPRYVPTDISTFDSTT